jgi:catechol-2,3-dioxygenase
VSDPDGNLIELYVDADPRLWRGDRTLVPQAYAGGRTSAGYRTTRKAAFRR